MNYEIKKSILNKIKEYDRIMLFRHMRNDGDCVGSTKGFKAILQASFPEKEILLIDDDHSAYLAFLGPEDPETTDNNYENALGIVLDTATTKRISNSKFTLCKELIKIDHHIPVEDYGAINWVEEERSSLCEMIVDFYDTFRDELVMTKEAALYLYTGMVTDSGRFRYRGVSGNTMRCAGILLDQGIDTETLYAHLYLDEFEYYKFKAYIYEHMNITENGVAYIHVTAEMKERFGLTDEDASNCVSMMDGIKGCLCWLAFIDSSKEPGTIRVRLRSRFMTVSEIAENYHGGGHACASGATVYSEDEMNALLADADAAIKAYKENHEGWL
jgi:phosphoesterase RecJ-like protein